MSIKKAGTTGTPTWRISLSTLGLALALVACGTESGDDVTADDDPMVDAGPMPMPDAAPDAPTACVTDPNDPCNCNRPWMDSPESKVFTCEITNASVTSATCDPRLIANDSACSVQCVGMFWGDSSTGLTVDATQHTFAFNDGQTRYNCHE